jgi:hypothetical protein
VLVVVLAHSRLAFVWPLVRQTLDEPSTLPVAFHCRSAVLTGQSRAIDAHGH